MRILLICVVVACGGGGDSKSSPPPSPGSGSASGSAPAKLKPVAIDAAVPDASPLGDLPPLDLAEVDAKVMEASVKLNNTGVAAFARKDARTATAKYEEALRTDPGNLLARYNLASAYSLAGDADRALALLAELARPDCRACTGILRHARTDGDWKALAGDPRFKTLVDGVTAPPREDLKKLTGMVIAAVRSGKTAGLEPYVHPRGPITMKEVAWQPEPFPPTYVYGWSGFVAWIGKGRKLEDNGVSECTKTCCRTGQRGDSSDVVDEVCFGGPGGVVFITSIELDYGPI